MMSDGNPYAFLEAQSHELTRSLVGFTSLRTPKPHRLDPKRWQQLNARYAALREFHATTLRLFQEDPVVCDLFVAELPEFLAVHHRQSIESAAPLEPPVFFRTDESVLGAVLEIQCAGSLWGTYEQLQDYYRTCGLTTGADLSTK